MGGFTLFGFQSGRRIVFLLFRFPGVEAQFPGVDGYGEFQQQGVDQGAILDGAARAGTALHDGGRFLDQVVERHLLERGRRQGRGQREKQSA